MRYLQGERIFSGQHFLTNETVLVVDENGVFKEFIAPEEVPAGSLERIDGILCPGFVNAHCHLELSHLKNYIPEKTGLPGFAMEVVKQRAGFTKEQIEDAMRVADQQMWERGIVAVGDISNGTDSFARKQASKIHYHTFIELIGLKPELADTIFEKGTALLSEARKLKLSASLAPHAPYSTSNQLIEKIAAFDQHQQLPFTIHNQESRDEQFFFEGKPSGFDRLYETLKLDISWFKAPGTSSLQHYAHLIPSHKTLLVHNTFTTPEDLQVVTSPTLNWCLCPRANLYIENQVPDFSIFASRKICIGTDSLASNWSLDLVEELNTILQHSRAFSVEDLLRASTSGGAEALGIDDRFGRFIPGKNAGLNILQLRNNQIQFIKKIA